MIYLLVSKSGRSNGETGPICERSEGGVRVLDEGVTLAGLEVRVGGYE